MVIVVKFAFTQNLSNIRKQTIYVTGDTLQLDTLSVIPGSEILRDASENIINSADYKIDHSKSLLIFDENSKLLSKKITITYRVFPYNFSQKNYHKDFENFKPDPDDPKDEFSFIYKEERDDDFFQDNKLNKRGSISRGINIGNNQDVIVNSSLNLQLSGKVNKDLEILAAISDNNIPIQPDGNSQQIQEFDKVYISLFNKTTKLTVGDFEVGKPVGGYMNLNKKVQGAILSKAFDINKEKKQSFKTTVSGAIAKGKYNKMKFDGQEGNQGPYKLVGSENEMYIIALAGTEKVYIDGKLLTRGQEYDYVVDYNTAEVTFTPNQPITKDKRIVIEFEYSDKNYSRFLIFNSNEYKSKNANLWLNVFSEQDSKNQPIQQELTDEHKLLLSEAGDNLELGWVPNVKDTVFTNDLVLYKRIDTIADNGNYHDSIYVYSTSPDSAHYILGFSKVGDGNGNYRQVQSSANGRVFKWVAPENGVLKGNYEPVTLLITPKKKQMVSFGGDIHLSKLTDVNFEISFTDNDINTFSSKNSDDDIGYAFNFNVLQKIPLKDTANSKLMASAGYQLIDKYFDPIEQFRSVEFERDWNLSDNTTTADEHLLNFNLDYKRKKFAKANYDFNYMNRTKGYSALNNKFVADIEKNGFTFNVDGSILNSEDLLNKTTFIRQKALLKKRISFVEIGVSEELEDNKWKLLSNDSLSDNSVSFFKWDAFIATPDTAKRGFFLNYSNRKDYQPYDNRLTYSTLGEDFNVGGRLLKNTNNTLKTSFNYRKLSIVDSLTTNIEAENTVTGRIEHSLKLFKGAISTSTFYEVGSGLEVKKEFSYLEVAPGQGVYQWTDYNNNGTKELDEFEVAIFQDKATYIRVFTPSNEYVKTYVNQFNQMLYFNPKRIWAKKTGIKKFATKFSNQFAYRINKKSSDDNFLVYSNPFVSDIEDSLLTSIGTSFRNTFSFNKTSSLIGIDYITQNNKNRTLLINGFDTRTYILNGLRLRWNITRKITLINNANTGDKTYSSEFFPTKNYNISYVDDETTLSIQPSQAMRISAIYKYSLKDNVMATEKTEENNFGLEFKYNILTKGNLSIKLNLIKLSYNSDANTSIAYVMLEGLQPGNNGTWSVLYQRSISKSLQLNLTYNGRISEDTDAIHTGGVQLRAFF